MAPLMSRRSSRASSPALSTSSTEVRTRAARHTWVHRVVGRDVVASACHLLRRTAVQVAGEHAFSRSRAACTLPFFSRSRSASRAGLWRRSVSNAYRQPVPRTRTCSPRTIPQDPPHRARSSLHVCAQGETASDGSSTSCTCAACARIVARGDLPCRPRPWCLVPRHRRRGRHARLVGDDGCGSTGCGGGGGGGVASADAASPASSWSSISSRARGIHHKTCLRQYYDCMGMRASMRASSMRASTLVCGGPSSTAV